MDSKVNHILHILNNQQDSSKNDKLKDPTLGLRKQYHKDTHHMFKK